MAPRGKFTSQSMAVQKRFSRLAHRDLTQHHGYRRGKKSSFLFSLGLSTPRGLPRLRSQLARKKPVARPFGCFLLVSNASPRERAVRCPIGFSPPGGPLVFYVF